MKNKLEKYLNGEIDAEELLEQLDKDIVREIETEISTRIVNRKPTLLASVNGFVSNDPNLIQITLNLFKFTGNDQIQLVTKGPIKEFDEDVIRNQALELHAILSSIEIREQYRLTKFVLEGEPFSYRGVVRQKATRKTFPVKLFISRRRDF